MSRQFRTADYAATLEVQVRLGDCVAPEHPARFLVDLLALVDFAGFRARFGARGGLPYDPAVLCGVLIYGYSRGVFSSRKLERATHEDLGFRYIAGNMHPDHDTLAHFRSTFLGEIKEVFVQVLVAAQASGVLLLQAVSTDGTKIHADASKSAAVSYGRLLKIEQEVHAEVEVLLAKAAETDAAADQEAVAAQLSNEVARREERLAQLAQARTVLEERAAARYAEEHAAYTAQMAERGAKAERTGKAPRGKEPQPPTPGARVKDHYNFTDPESRIMKESASGGFDQDYNAQVVVDQASMLVIGALVCNQPNDVQALLPTLDAIPAAVGVPRAVASDTGFFSAANITGCAVRGIEPSIATGREAHRWSLDKVLSSPSPVPVVANPGPRVAMAAKLATPEGRAIYRLRKCTVEPAIGIIKEAMGFRQFSLRRLAKVSGEWILVCLAYNIKRLHTLLGGCVPSTTPAAHIATAVVIAGVLLTAAATSIGRAFSLWSYALLSSVPDLTRHSSDSRLCQFSPTGC